MVAPEPYWEKIRRLRTQAGLSQPALYRESGVSIGTIRGLEKPYEDQRGGAPNSARYPSADTLERLAEALGVEADAFAEYRLAKARELLDERQVGLEEATAHLDRITAALRTVVAQRVAKTAEQQEERHRKPRAIRDEDQTPGAGA